MDTLTRPTLSELQASSIRDLKDTIKTKLVIDNYDKVFFDKYDSSGNLCITFKYYRGDYVHAANYIFPQKLYRNIDTKTNFEIDWFVAFERSSMKPTWSFYSYKTYIQGDTIFTYTCPVECGGTTPESHTFRFASDRIDSIQVKTKAMFYVSQGFDLNGRDDWAVHLYDLETEWMNCRINNNSYTLPTVNDVVIDKDTFSKIRKKAIAVQKETLIEKRDSIRPYLNEAERERAINDVLKRFKSNLDDAETATDLYLALELNYFINNVTVFYRGGSTKEFVHIAGYETSVP